MLMTLMYVAVAEGQCRLAAVESFFGDFRPLWTPASANPISNG